MEFTNLERSIIVHALFRYAEYLREVQDLPFKPVISPMAIENLALKINELRGDDNG